MKTLTCYLAGAIRDNRPEDILWREQFAEKFNNDILNGILSLLSPLAGKELHNGQWGAHGMQCDTPYIVNSDFWSVDKADIIVFNLLALGDKYPCIGTLLEFGRSTSRSVLRYGILPANYTGHENEQFANCVHPFIRSQCVAVFPTVDSCLHYIWHSLPALAGLNPRAATRGTKDRGDELLRKLPAKAFFKV